MATNTNVERLLPSLYAFLSADPTDAPTAQPSPPTTRAPPTARSSNSDNSSSSGNTFGPLYDVSNSLLANSCRRWRRCLDVWRRVVGNDVVFLTLLLHAGCLWSPDYATLQHTKHAIEATEAEERRRRVKAEATRAAVVASGTHTTNEEMTSPATAAADGIVNEGFVDGTASPKRRGKRGFAAAAEVARQASRAAAAQAATARSHQRLTELCPASMWALHVLHFLRIEEIYSTTISDEVAGMHGMTKGSTQKKRRRGHSSASTSVVESSSSGEEDTDAGSSADSDSDNDRNSDSGAEEREGSRSSSSSSSSSAADTSDADHHTNGNDGDDDDDDGVIIDVRGERGGSAGNERRGTAFRRSRANGEQSPRGRVSARIARHKRPRDHRSKHTAEESRTARVSATAIKTQRKRKKVKVDDGDSSSMAHFTTARRQLAASSALLPREVKKLKSSKRESELSLAASLAALQAEEERRAARRAELCTAPTPKQTGGTSTSLGGGHVNSTPTVDDGNGVVDDSTLRLTSRAQALFLRATVTLISEEEPLVQQVAAALVEEWFDLVGDPCLFDQGFGSDERRSSDGDGGKRGEDQPIKVESIVRHQQHPPLSSAHPAGKAVDATAQAQQQREARHYWLSCLLKMVAYLDGAHSALRDECAHLSAVLARQGVAVQEADDTFTKSLPAIFNCVLVEEVMQMAQSGQSRLWMPPPVLLLPFHLLSRGSRIGVWVPSTEQPEKESCTGATTATLSAAASTSAAEGRVAGRYVNFTVVSPGIHLSMTNNEGTYRSASCRIGKKRKNEVPAAKSTTRASHSRLQLRLQASEPEMLLDQRCRRWLEALLPPCSSDLLLSTNQAGGKAQTPNVVLPRPAGVSDETAAPHRWWSCTQAATLGCPRVTYYVARTLLMLPIPAQSTLDSTSNHEAQPDTRSTTGTGVGGAADVGNDKTTPRNESGYAAKRSAGVGRPRRGAFANFSRARLSQDELAVRRRHPLLFHALQHHLRSPTRQAAFALYTGTRSASLNHNVRPNNNNNNNHSNSTGSGATSLTDVDGTQLVLLYGLARGEEATALRQIGFSVRSGSHHGLGRGGGAAGGRKFHADASPSVSSGAADEHSRHNSRGNNSSSSGGGGASKGGSGRLTMARDALGTTLEGLYLIARRVLALRGLYAHPDGSYSSNSSSKGGVQHSGGASATPQPHADGAREEKGSGKGKGSWHVAKGKGNATQAAAAASSAPSKLLTPAEECDVLGTAAATLVLTSLLLSHNLMDELIEQPALTLWTTELASYVVDVSLLTPAPRPRLLRADGFALSLLLQPAQSLLVMVGLVGTLVSRETEQVERGTPGPVRNGCGAAAAAAAWVGTGGRGAAVTWQPWWTTFRHVVLRDATLPSCLYGGMWALVTQAENAVSVAAAQARWETSRPTRTTTTAAAAAAEGVDNGSGGGSSGRRRSAHGSSGRRLLLKLTAAAAAGTATSAEDKTMKAGRNSSSSSTGGASGAVVSAPASVAVPGQPSQFSAAAVAGHRRLLQLPVTKASINGGADADGGLRWMCGPAVLEQPQPARKSHKSHSSDSRDEVRLSALPQVHEICVVSGAEMTFRDANHSQARAHFFASSLSVTDPCDAVMTQRDAAASALWLLLETSEVRCQTKAKDA